jgi:hypothetical protein
MLWACTEGKTPSAQKTYTDYTQSTPHGAQAPNERNREGNELVQ